MRTFFVLFFLLLLAAGGAVWFSFSQWRAPYTTADTTVVIEPRHGTQTILKQLSEAAVLPPSWQIMLPLVLDGRTHSLKAGEYEFAAGMSPEQVIDKIARGQAVIHKLTIPEGWNRFQVAEVLKKEPLLTGEMPEIVEGSIFPDTMLFQRNQTRASLVEKMQARMRDTLESEWAGRADGLPLTSPEQALVVASMIEKETGVADERAMIAGVFYNRLAKGMKLQSDPTVVYGMEVAKGEELGRALTTADLQKDTPYNSYTREGLPPGPICNPGQASIRAALHPAATNALYFVATGFGGHSFSATLKEHNTNVANYRKVTEKSGGKR